MWYQLLYAEKEIVGELAFSTIHHSHKKVNFNAEYQVEADLPIPLWTIPLWTITVLIVIRCITDKIKTVFIYFSTGNATQRSMWQIIQEVPLSLLLWKIFWLRLIEDRWSSRHYDHLRFPSPTMALSDYLTFIAVVVAAWSLYRYHLLEEQLPNRSMEKTRMGTQEVSSVQEEEGDSKTPDKKFLEGGTSVWCVGSSNIDRMCRFHNICFSRKHEEFVFLDGPQSITSGLPLKPFDPALVDLSSIPNHNTQYFEYCSLPVSALDGVQTVKLFHGKHIIMNRFNPSNIMHVFHDDLLPLFYTMLQNGFMSKRDFQSDAQLVFLDGFPAEEFIDLFVTLFRQHPLLRSDLVGDLTDDSLVCFEEAHVGLSNTTVWYQYGFYVPQGRIPNTLLTATKVKFFTSFVHAQIGFTGCDDSDDYAVLITRRSTRLILNEMELVLQIAQRTGMRVLTAGLEDFSITDLVELITCAKVLIGMHGSLLILAMFLPVGSVLLELFPYAINPDHYTPYRTLVELQGMGITYRAWRNMNPDHSVAHPDALPENGGVHHLSLEEQRRILESTEVPKHLCCSNPDWLFRIYQDTIVDVSSLLNSLSDALVEYEQLGTQNIITSNVSPSKIQNIKCVRGKGLHVSWQRPWNIEYMNTNDVKYEVWIQGTKEERYKAYMLQLTEYLFSDGIEQNISYRVWVRCTVENVQGPFAAVICWVLYTVHEYLYH